MYTLYIILKRKKKNCNRNLRKQYTCKMYLLLSARLMAFENSNDKIFVTKRLGFVSLIFFFFLNFGKREERANDYD